MRCAHNPAARPARASYHGIMKEFDTILGYASIKGELERIADCLKNPSTYKRLGAHMPSGLLLCGEPGLGKTLMATCLIEASGLGAIVCRKSKRSSKMVDAVCKAFDQAADQAPAIVFLDDMDKLSNSSYDLCDTDEYVTIQACIDEYKGRGVFVLATANDVRKLPRSLVREGRFDRVIRLHAPRGQDARDIVAYCLGKSKCLTGLDAHAIARLLEGRSCAFLETVINEARIAAAFERAEAITLEHFVKAYVRASNGGGLYAAKDAPGCPALLQDAGASAHAQAVYHEAAHVLVAELVCPGSNAIAFIAEDQGATSGIAKHNTKEADHSYVEARNSILVGLAGSIGIEQKFGIPACGGSSDSAEVFKLVEQLMTDAFMCGPYFAGKERFDASDALYGELERTAAVVLEQFRWEARQLVASNMAALEGIAQRLYTDGYILGDEVTAIVSGAMPAPPGRKEVA